ncbi:hypothetical protein [Listeria fleischmannii]|uniref:hypothetical protein n=1 Tax=Listeria fleischmannii TaxID=1069827 RepID=UPI000254F3ED|nr:hypothetical protein [Listeria fleischmannii]EIA19604.1 hypothetical protein KKC_11546 [Listeria fleischmannii subsp. coloradonensis]MBC1419405.1 hypothetical protein [Listeria fleischmannii]STY35300.1 Uncharacterised protein [Listeria fleischmannii subsp. coloradonensis]
MELYKVIAVPDDTRIIINLGKENNPESDFELLGREVEVSEKGIEIIDPDTKEVLGSYDPVKARLEITNVYDKFSVARKVIITNQSPLQQMVLSPMLKTAEKTTYESLNVNEEDISHTTLNSNIISIGDLVKLV